jgi:hypothetical protein
MAAPDQLRQTAWFKVAGFAFFDHPQYDGWNFFPASFFLIYLINTSFMVLCENHHQQ